MIELRPAKSSDLALLRYWDEQPHVVGADPNDDWEWEIELQRSPDWREQLIAEFRGMPIGFIQIIDPAREDSQYWGDIEHNLRAIDIWIGEEKNLNKGFGTQMMKKALARCFANQSVKAVLVDPLSSNNGAHRFYERLGFQLIEEKQFGDDHCIIYQMERQTYETIA